MTVFRKQHAHCLKTRSAWCRGPARPDRTANPGQGADPRARGGACRWRVICLPEIFRAQYFLQREEHCTLRYYGRADPRPPARNGWPPWLAKSSGNHRLALCLFKRRAAGLYPQHCVELEAMVDRRTRSQNEYPRRSALLEKFYSQRDDLASVRRRLLGRVGHDGLLGSWYPEGARITALAGRTVTFYPTGHSGWEFRTERRSMDAWRHMTPGRPSSGPMT